jgi:hypothetical protein
VKGRNGDEVRVCFGKVKERANRKVKVAFRVTLPVLFGRSHRAAATDRLGSAAACTSRRRYVPVALRPAVPGRLAPTGC